MGNNIRKIRKEKGMTIEELSNLSGLSKVIPLSFKSCILISAREVGGIPQL